MDYEELYQQLQTLEKDFKDKLTTAQKTLKSLSKNSEKGELKSLSRDLGQMQSFIRDYEKILAAYSHLAEDFDLGAYMTNGDFARQMQQYCNNLSVDITGDFPVYEIFPNRVKIDPENMELNVDRKKVQCARPLYFVKSLKQNQDKLNKAAFNVTAFVTELSDAYDKALIQKEKISKTNKSEHDIFLKDLYNYLVPMQRFRRDYDMQSYAFDLARLYNSDVESAKDGRGFEFGTSRIANKLIRILDKDGKEQYLGTIRFFMPSSL